VLPPGGFTIKELAAEIDPVMLTGITRPAFGLVLRPEIAALSISGSSLLVAANAPLLNRLRRPAPQTVRCGVDTTPSRLYDTGVAL